MRGVLRLDGALSITTADDAHDEEASQRFVESCARLLGDRAEPLHVRDLNLAGPTRRRTRSTVREAMNEARTAARVGAAPGTIAGSTLHERAMAALPRWLCGDPVSGLDEVLFPNDSMGLIEEDDARAVARALRGVGQSAGFLERWRHVRIQQGRRRPMSPTTWLAPAPQEAIEMLRPVLRRLWPEWEGWAAPPPRQHIMEEYVYDLQTARFWDLVYCRPIADAALDADIWRACWPTIVVDGKQIAIPPSEWMKSREVGYLVDAVARIPGAGRIVSDVMFDYTGRRYVPGTRLFNTWRAGPAVEPDASDADKWLDLACRLFEGRSWGSLRRATSFSTLEPRAGSLRLDGAAPRGARHCQTRASFWRCSRSCGAWF